MNRIELVKKKKKVHNGFISILLCLKLPVYLEHSMLEYTPETQMKSLCVSFFSVLFLSEYFTHGEPCIPLWVFARGTPSDRLTALVCARSPLGRKDLTSVASVDASHVWDACDTLPQIHGRFIWKQI